MIVSHKTERKTQQVLGIIFSSLLFATIIVNSWTIALRNKIPFLFAITHLEYVPLTNWILLTTLCLFVVISVSDNNICRTLQAFIFGIMGALAIIDSHSEFWGWGFFLVSVSLLNHYGFWNKKLWLKSFILGSILLSVICLSLFLNKEPFTHFFTIMIYASFLFFFLLFIKREELSRMAREKQNLQKMLEEVETRKMAVETMQDQIEENANSELEDELKQKLAIQQAFVIENENKIRSSIERLPSNRKLTEGELDLVVCFFSHRGAVTNKELGFNLTVSEDAVKNRFKSVFHKMGVSSRTELFSFIIQNL